MDTQSLRNIALVGQGSVGKTTLADALVFECGQVTRLGKVGDNTSVFDHLPEEHERAISMGLTLGYGEYRKHRLTFVDTPGYADFYGEPCAALHVCDAAALVVCAYMGVEVQTERLWRTIQEAGKPCLAVINKMDAERADFDAVLGQLQEDLGIRTAPLFVPVGAQQDFRGVVDVVHEKAYLHADGKLTESEVPGELTEQVAEYRDALIEAAAEGDDDLLEKYLEEEEPLTVFSRRRPPARASLLSACRPSSKSRLIGCCRRWSIHFLRQRRASRRLKAPSLGAKTRSCASARLKSPSPRSSSRPSPTRTWAG